MCAAVRRQPVARGGMFSTPKATFSKETQELLKVMMSESKLTNFQQRQLKETMKSGHSLPVRCHPTSSRQDLPGPHPRPRKATKPKSHSQGLRSKVTIDKMADPEPDYRPAPNKYNSSKEKKRLQNVMAFGSELDPVPPTMVARGNQGGEDEEEVDRFEEVLGEIEERRQFLVEMERVGRGKEYRTKIMTEISQRIRELEVLDQQRCSELTIRELTPHNDT